MYRIMKNCWIDEVRSRNRHAARLVPEEAGLSIASEDHLAIERHLELGEVDRAMASLPPEQREVIGLVLVEELVTANKGQISVVSEVDKGTTFQLIFSSVPTNSSRFATGEAGVGVVFQRKDPTFVP